MTLSRQSVCSLLPSRPRQESGLLASHDGCAPQSTADLSHPRAARMLSGDLNVMLADAEGASPPSSTDLSPADSEPADLRSAARRMYLGEHCRC